ncbi:lysozyme [Synechococcus phage S-CRES2]|nr:lysozyme [Synechococcus phage S-CRES2]
MADPIFWQKFYDLGKAAGAKFPELVAAQAALESGWGEHVSGKNNYFGIKGSPGTIKTTQEWNGSRMVTIEDEFKDFDTPLDSVKHLVSRWYEDYRGYRGVNRASTAQEAAMLLKEEGYATDPVYPELLINLMMDNHAGEEADGYFLPNAAKYYAEEPHQTEAWRMLEDSLEPEVLEAFKAAYRRSPIVAPVQKKYPLNVPYYNQNDSATQHGHRMCFSSAMAMALDCVDSAKMEGDDDWYLNEVFKFGDTVSSDAQVAAAESLGFDVEFRTDGNVKDLEELLDEGTPVPVGILHQGSADHPTGGGHWITLIGHDDTHFWVHDPAGDLDLVNGGYHTWDSGEKLRYSKKNLLKRWNIAGDSDGWYIRIR